MVFRKRWIKYMEGEGKDGGRGGRRKSGRSRGPVVDFRGW